eukprot:2673978-Amphidinium_carterae.1
MKLPLTQHTTHKQSATSPVKLDCKQELFVVHRSFGAGLVVVPFSAIDQSNQLWDDFRHACFHCKSNAELLEGSFGNSSRSQRCNVAFCVLNHPKRNTTKVGVARAIHLLPSETRICSVPSNDMRFALGRTSRDDILE